MTLSVGLVFATQTTADVSGDTPQAEAVRRNRDAERAASRSTVLLGVGGAAVVLGAGIWAADLLLLDNTLAGAVVAAPTPGGATFAWTCVW